jgi:hypothetical protein
MSFGMIDTEVQHSMREVRRQIARHRAPDPARPAPAAGAARAEPVAMAARGDRRRRPGLRSRIGFTLVETGLRLLASGQAHG